MTRPPHFDAYLPAQIAAKAEDAGVAKGNLNLLSTFLLAVLAGAFIAMGAIFSTVAVTGAADHLPWGVIRVLAGLTFCLGLILVVVAGAELFTGNNLLVMAFVSGKLPISRLMRNWLIVYVGNFVGSIATAWVMFLTAQHTFADGQLGVTALRIANAKCNLTVIEALTRGIYCNALVCLAVWLCYSCRTTTDRILAIIFPITAFVAAGFEHCVANMYFVPTGLAIKTWANDAYWTMVDMNPGGYSSLTWGNFFVANLLPVTIGNILGGAGFVAAVYWTVYCRKQTR